MCVCVWGEGGDSVGRTPRRTCRNVSGDVGPWLMGKLFLPSSSYKCPSFSLMSATRLAGVASSNDKDSSGLSEKHDNKGDTPERDEVRVDVSLNRRLASQRNFSVLGFNLSQGGRATKTLIRKKQRHSHRVRAYSGK